jgi:hypothetical protein
MVREINAGDAALSCYVSGEIVPMRLIIQGAESWKTHLLQRGKQNGKA